MNNQVFDMVALMKIEEIDLRKLAENSSMPVKLLWDNLFAFLSEETPPEKLPKILSDIGADGDSPPEAVKKLQEKVRNALRAERDEDDDIWRRNLGGYLKIMDEEEATRKLRVLCVDDAALILQTLATVLGKDYEVFSLTKGSQVEKFLKHTTPEMFILDYSMPDIMGLDIVPIIRKHPEHKETPIIMLTALGTTERVKDALAAGLCDFVIKPVKSEVLKKKVAKHIVRKKTF
jgi:PleD family two-component response regulator